MSRFDVLRVSAGKPAVRNPLHRDDNRPGEAWEHKHKAIPGFTAQYGVDKLVWYEQHASLESAFVREQQLKKWKRAWKIELIEKDNPQWIELYPSIAM